MCQPYEALLAHSSDSAGPAPLRAAHEHFVQWRTLSPSKWRDVWRKRRFDELCSVLPRLLEEWHILPAPYLCYSYVPNSGRGRWADAHGASTAASSQARFAVLLTLTPVPHYTLLERIDVRAVTPSLQR